MATLIGERIMARQHHPFLTTYGEEPKVGRGSARPPVYDHDALAAPSSPMHKAMEQL
jgi:hypothetical protein